MNQTNAKVKNKAVAPLQISAEQILLEAFERKEQPLKAGTQQITDVEELREFQGRKRKEYEDALRRNRLNIGQWMRYATWELEQREFERARSVFERALDVESSNVSLWIRYIQAELKERNISHARNLLDRAVTLLPRVDKLWFTYVSVEETLSNVDGTRLVFERWLKWQPTTNAWLSYINMEKRYQEYDKARDIYSRFTIVHPQSENWIKWAKFEEEFGSTDNVRDVYTLAVDSIMSLGAQYLDEKILLSWAKWEARVKEWERARAIFKLGLERLPKSKSTNLYNSYTAFEKQYGNTEGMEDVILSKRRAKYEEDLKDDPYNYDTWFAYLTLVEDISSNVSEGRDVYERAISMVPAESSKQHWRRYIYLWIRYAIYEELTNNDIERTRKIYQQCVKIIPHKSFSFGKIWLMYAKFEIRQGDIDRARKILGQAIGLSGKPNLYRGYIEMETKLKEFDRCRILYEKYLEKYPDLPQGWIHYAELEQMLGDEERARGIFELAISQPEMEMPELVWKRYIDFETEEGNYQMARNLFEILLEKTGHVKVWISYGVFEISVPEEEDENEEIDDEVNVSDEAKERSRNVFKRAWDSLKHRGQSEDRVVLNDAWLQFEQTYGTEETVAKIEAQAPQMVKKRKKLDDGSYEEYLDYVFPTDEINKPLSKFLDMAKKWKAASSGQ
jgi:crooked neck